MGHREEGVVLGVADRLEKRQHRATVHSAHLAEAPLEAFKVVGVNEYYTNDYEGEGRACTQSFSKVGKGGAPPARARLAEGPDEPGRYHHRPPPEGRAVYEGGEGGKRADAAEGEAALSVAPAGP